MKEIVTLCEQNPQSVSLIPVMLEDHLFFLSSRPGKDWDEKTTEENTMIVSGDLILDLYGKVLYRKGKLLSLTRSEFVLASTLAINSSVLISREVLLETIEDCYCHTLRENTLSKYVHRIREKLREENGTSEKNGPSEKQNGGRQKEYVATHRSIGYQWGQPARKMYLCRLEGLPARVC